MYADVYVFYLRILDFYLIKIQKDLLFIKFSSCYNRFRKAESLTYQIF